MKTAICYYSTHHGNTLQVARAMTQGYDVDFFDLSTQREAALRTMTWWVLLPAFMALPFIRRWLPLRASTCPRESGIFRIHLWDCQRDRRQGNHQGIPGEERKDTGGI